MLNREGNKVKGELQRLTRGLSKKDVALQSYSTDYEFMQTGERKVLKKSGVLAQTNSNSA